MKKKYYLTLDTETATLPFIDKLCTNEIQRKKIAIAKPLVYDIGWIIIDRKGNKVKQENFLVQETFFVPNIFNTAYYKEKRPIYIEMLKRGEIVTANWNNIIDVLLEDLRQVDISTAYNATFDYKKAIPFTERYIEALYSADYNEWERRQYNICRNILNGTDTAENPDFLTPIFELRGENFPITDLWSIACDRLINIDKYRNYCLKNNLLTASAQFFKSSAETTFQYLMRQHDFTEDHTALSDALIESAVLVKALKKGAVKEQIDAFPFRNLGTTTDYVTEKKPKYAAIVRDALFQYITVNAGWDKDNQYWKKVKRLHEEMEELI